MTVMYFLKCLLISRVEILNSSWNNNNFFLFFLIFLSIPNLAGKSSVRTEQLLKLFQKRMQPGNFGSSIWDDWNLWNESQLFWKIYCPKQRKISAARNALQSFSFCWWWWFGLAWLGWLGLVWLLLVVVGGFFVCPFFIWFFQRNPEPIWWLQEFQYRYLSVGLRLHLYLDS